MGAPLWESHQFEEDPSFTRWDSQQKDGINLHLDIASTDWKLRGSNMLTPEVVQVSSLEQNPKE